MFACLVGQLIRRLQQTAAEFGPQVFAGTGPALAADCRVPSGDAGNTLIRAMRRSSRAISMASKPRKLCEATKGRDEA
jgi:hypothetical protein